MVLQTQDVDRRSGSVDFFAIPVPDEGTGIDSVAAADKFILYRPLRRLAFVANAAMARLVTYLLADPASDTTRVPAPVLDYLRGTGFLDPDPPPPPARDPDYCPTTAVLLMTGRCNLRCVYCYAAGGETGHRDLPEALALAAIDRVCDNALQAGRPLFELVFHGGGEPTLPWDTLTRAVSHARSKSLPCRVSMVSNGLWSARQRAWIVGNVDRVTVSVDGGRETQNRQRPSAAGKGTYDAVMRSVAHLDRYGLNYSFRLTALAPWGETLARDVESLCQETGCRRLQVEPAFSDRRGSYRAPTDDEVDAFVFGFVQAYDVAWRAGRRLTFSGARPWLLTHSFCSAPFGGLVVTPSGTLVACYEVTNAAHPLAALCTVGHLDADQALIDHEKRALLLARLAERRAACRDCFCYWHCAGDCHAKAFYPGAGATPMAGARCRMNREITAHLLLSYIAASDGGLWRGQHVGPQIEHRTREESC
ncbi:MAG TPA: radical SAM protein [Anaerolineae bacterium]|nr:radical SAM protein [Anaerolineae bacterium]